jgi:hypothetical protein
VAGGRAKRRTICLAFGKAVSDAWSLLVEINR